MVRFAGNVAQAGGVKEDEVAAVGTDLYYQAH
jgi:hypothetical protein